MGSRWLWVRTRHKPGARPWITTDEAERLLRKKQARRRWQVVKAPTSSMAALIDAFEARVPERAMRARSYVAANGAKVTVREPLCEDCNGQGCFECGNTGYRRG